MTLCRLPSQQALDQKREGFETGTREDEVDCGHLPRHDSAHPSLAVSASHKGNQPRIAGFELSRHCEGRDALSEHRSETDHGRTIQRVAINHLIQERLQSIPKLARVLQPRMLRGEEMPITLSERDRILRGVWECDLS